MNCSEFNIYLDRNLHGTLSPDERADMARHAGVCRDCARLLAAHQMIAASFDTTEPVIAPQGFADRIRARINAEESGVVLPFTAPAYASVPETVSCDTFESNAVAFVDGLLSDDLTRDMAAHRASCDTCERLARAHETVTAAFTDTEPVLAPVGLANRIYAAALETETVAEPVTAPINIRKFDILVAAAAFVSMIMGGMLLVNLRNPAAVTPSPIAQMFDSFILHVTMLPALFEAWIVRTIPAEQWITIARLLDPIELPYLPFSASRLFYLAIGVSAITTWCLALRFIRNPMTFKQRF